MAGGGGLCSSSRLSVGRVPFISSPQGRFCLNESKIMLDDLAREWQVRGITGQFALNQEDLELGNA